MLPQKVILLQVMTLWAWSHEADTEWPTDTFVPLLNQDWISSADAALWSSCRVRLCAARYIQDETRWSPQPVSAKSRTEQEFEWMAVRHLFQSDSALLTAPAATICLLRQTPFSLWPVQTCKCPEEQCCWLSSSDYALWDPPACSAGDCIHKPPPVQSSSEN